MVDKIQILKGKGGIAMAILSMCYFIWFTCSLESIGLIKFELFGPLTWWIFQMLIVISLIAINISYKVHNSLAPLIIGLVSAAIIFHAYHFEHKENWHVELTMGMGGFTVATIMNFLKLKQQKQPGKN
jgi:hypothetical protein